MTVTQYIGAPYIPHGWTTWQPATAYDGMSVVEYNLVWYIAKQPVPIGIAPTGDQSDPYWAPVDRWNGQVEEYRKEVEMVSQVIKYPFTKKNIKRVLIIGDSWGTGFNETTPYPTLLNNMVEVVNISRNGFGFTGAGANQKFIQLINNTVDINFSEVFIIGGTNDGASSTLYQDINECLAAAKAKFTKSNIYVGYAGLLNQRYGIVSSYRQGAFRNGCMYITGLENLGCSKAFYTETTHPTQAFQQTIANYLYYFLQGNFTEITYSEIRSNLENVKSGAVTIGVNNGRKFLRFGYTVIDNVSNNINLGNNYDYLQCNNSWYVVPPIIGTVNGSQAVLNGYYYYNNGLFLAVNIDPSDTITQIQVGAVSYNDFAYLI